MNNIFDDMREAMTEARCIMHAADNCAGDMARMLSNRLHKCGDVRALTDLKRELKDFNIHTGKWMR